MNTRIEKVADQLYTHSLQIATFLAFLIFFIILFIRYKVVMGFATDAGGVEPNVLYGIQRILKGLPLYSNPEEPPFAIIQYTPGYYYLTAAIGKILSVDENSPLMVYRLSRATSLVLNLASLGVIYWGMGRAFQTTSRFKVVSCAAVFLYFEPEIYSRPDSIYNFFSLAYFFAFYLFVQEEHRRRKMAWVVAASFFSVLAVFSKQSGIVLILVSIFFLIFYLPAKRFAFMYFIAVILFSSLFLWPFDMGTFFQNVIGGINNGINIEKFYYRIWGAAFTNFGLVIFSGLLGSLLLLRRENSLPFQYCGLMLAASFLFSLATALKDGAAPNYFTEFNTLAITIVLGTSLNLYPESKGHPLTGLIVIVFLMVSFPINSVGKYWEPTYFGNEKVRFEAAENLTLYLKNDLKLQPNEKILLEPDLHTFVSNINFWNLLQLHLHQNVLFPQRDIIACCSYPRAVYDYSTFERNANEGLVRYIIRQHQGELQFLGISLSNFEKVAQRGQYEVWKWKD